MHSIHLIGMLHYIIYNTCPPFSKILINTYRNPARLIISAGEELRSQEGTTQGDNLAMSFYGLATSVLLHKLKLVCERIKQVWLADDVTGAGLIRDLREWWDNVIVEGEKIGYYVNENKSWLILKDPSKLDQVKETFSNTQIKITVEGKRHLGAVVGNDDFRKHYIDEKVDGWCSEIEKLAKFAETQPHAAFAAYIHGEQHKFTYFLRTIPGMEEHLERLDDIIEQKFIPALFGHNITASERELFSQPIKSDGLGIQKLSEKSTMEYEASKLITASLTSVIVMQGNNIPSENEVRELKNKMMTVKVNRNTEKLKELETKMSEKELRSVNQLRDKGASSWLSALPLQEHGLVLNKSEFRDALAIRYNQKLKGLPEKCACGQNFDLNHAMNCKKGGFVSMRHYEIKKFEATLLNTVCNDVEVEPPLQPVTGEIFRNKIIEGDEARLDIKARGFWRKGQMNYFDIRVTNINTNSQIHQPSEKIYQKHEKEKKRKYGSRIMEIEHGTFTPLIYSITGGMGPECSIFHKHLANRIAEKTGNKYEKILTLIRTKLSFLIMKSALLCVRGSRAVGSKNQKTFDDDFDIIFEDLRLS